MIPRVIPCLLLQDKGLVKTVQFQSPRYIGDPINAVRIFNEMEADELMFIDIEASRLRRDIDWETVEEIANEAFMPLCYGGGIKTAQQAERLFRIGIEKVSLNSVVFQNPGILDEISSRFGSQSVMVTLDVLMSGNKYMLYQHASKQLAPISLEQALERAVAGGAGEITINHVDRDGMMGGYDLRLLQQVTRLVNLPVVACGGCGSLADMRQAVEQGGASAIAAGSIFVYWGRLNGILINYPKREKLKSVFQ